MTDPVVPATSFERLETNDFVRAKTDKKNYRLITLKNGLEVLLVTSSAAKHADDIGSDSESFVDGDNVGSFEEVSTLGGLNDDESLQSEEQQSSRGSERGHDARRGFGACAVAMAVGVGSFHEQEAEPHGLAHLLEHMLFMGSEKYPAENAYDDHLHRNGGFSNAFTEAECTVYYFEVAQPGLHQALDIFAQFFISPLMLHDSLAREINAVDSEFDTVLADDDLRMKAVWRLGTVTQDHPYARFCWGNSSSLKQGGGDLREKLIQFYLRHYRVDKMKLVVWSVDEPDIIEHVVRESFEAIPVRPRGAPDIEIKEPELTTRFGMPFSPQKSLGFIHRILPVHDCHILRLTWQYEPSKSYRISESDYVGHLVGHESEGGILTYLKSAGWATDLWAGTSDDDGHESSTICRLFAVELKLTAQGAQNWEDCVAAIYAYLGMLVREAPQQWVFEEIQQITQSSFDYKDEGEPLNEVGELAVSLLPKSAITDRCHLLCAGQLVFDYEPEAIAHLLSKLGYEGETAPRIDLVSSSFGRESDVSEESVDTLPIAGEYGREQYWGARFWRERMSDTLKDRLASCLLNARSGTVTFRLPPRNSYIPRSLEIYPIEPKRAKEESERALHPLVGAKVEIRLRNGKKFLWIPASCTSARRRLRSQNDDSKQFDENNSVEIKVEFESHLEPSVWLSTVGINSFPSLSRHVLDFANDRGEFVNVRILLPALPPCPVLMTNSSNNTKLYWLQDSVSRVPRAALFLCIRTQSLMLSARNRALADLLIALAVRELDHDSYLAKMAGLELFIKVHDDGIVLSMMGFSEKLLDLLKRALPVLLKFLRFDFNPKDYEEEIRLETENLIRHLKNAENDTDVQANNLRLRAVIPNSYGKRELATELENINPGNMLLGACRFDESISIDALAHGNVSRKEAEGILKTLRMLCEPRKRPNNVASEVNNRKRPRVVDIERGRLNAFTVPSWELSEKTSALQLYFQLGEDSPENQALGEALELLMDEPLFNELRTKQQLGYIVSCGLRRTHGMLGFAVELTSSKYTPHDCLTRFEKFLSDFQRDELNEISDIELRKRLESLSRRILQKDAGMFTETKRHWHPIFEQTLKFNEKWLVVHQLLHQPRPGNRFGLSMKDVRRFFDANFAPSNRRSLLIVVVGGQSLSTVNTVRETLTKQGIMIYDNVHDFWTACSSSQTLTT